MLNCRHTLCFCFLACLTVVPSALAQPATRPAVAMYPPTQDNGRCFRELFEQPDQWKDTRSLISAIGYADHQLNKQFTDEQLGAWLPMLQQWGVKLELEVGAVKPWGPTGEKTFNVQRKTWDRVQRLGGRIHAIAMDEPLCCARKEIHQDDDYAVAETAAFVALVRKQYPGVRIGDIEPYPFIPLADQIRWFDALGKRLADMQVRGLDFYRLDVNWAEFTVFDRGNWQEVRKIERHCRTGKVPFSLIYWASDYPSLKRRGLADDSTWYVSIMRQGQDYVMVDGVPDQYVIESWIQAPSRNLPDSAEFSFTRSVRDFVRKFVTRDK
ncbi:MAG: hypothetical protein ABSH20_17195 [Tepidisphaeraceae bacterium]|jgi:hypothetical protein